MAIRTEPSRPDTTGDGQYAQDVYDQQHIEQWKEQEKRIKMEKEEAAAAAAREEEES